MRQFLTESFVLAALGGGLGLLLARWFSEALVTMAFQVSRRTNEIGLRMALGASRGGIVALVLREVVAMLLVGCAMGTLLALSVTSLTRRMGITLSEPGIFALAAAILGVAARAAAWLSARRAARVDPMLALRNE